MVHFLRQVIADQRQNVFGVRIEDIASIGTMHLVPDRWELLVKHYLRLYETQTACKAFEIEQLKEDDIRIASHEFGENFNRSALACGFSTVSSRYATN